MPPLSLSYIKEKWRHAGFQKYLKNTGWMFGRGENMRGEKMKTPEGTFGFIYPLQKKIEQKNFKKIIFEKSPGNHIFRVESTNDNSFTFFYSSTSTGTKIATINLCEMVSYGELEIILIWSPKETHFHLKPRCSEGQALHAIGQPCDFVLQKDKNGNIHQIGCENSKIMNYDFYENGKSILSPSAINSWRDVKIAIEILNTGKSEEGYIYETILSNIIITMLTTGFEVYAKKRIFELEEEGIRTEPKKYLSKLRKDIKIESIKRNSIKMKTPLLEYIIKERKINFQNYKKCREVYRIIVGIDFDSINIKEGMLRKLRYLLEFRNEIIHTSPISNMINFSNVPPEKPIFSNRIQAIEAVNVFDSFINKLHEATLNNRN